MQDPEQFTIDSILKRLKERFPKEADEIIYFFDWDLVYKFALFLKEKNEAGGFFSKRDSEEILDRHVLESVYHVYRITKKSDLGSKCNLEMREQVLEFRGFSFVVLKNIRLSF